MQRLRLALFSLLAIALAAPAGLYLATQGASADGHTLEARAGDGEEGYSVDLFLPENITVTTGTTISWSFPWLEPHSVSFGVPAEGSAEAPSNPGENLIAFDGETPFSSGLRMAPDGEPFQVEFTTEGEFDIYCAIHPNMTGTVTVVDPEGDTEPDTQEDLNGRASTQYSDALAELQGIAADESAEDIDVEELDDGSSRYTMEVGAESLVGVAMQYFPPSLDIMEGDSVRFLNEGMTPHTASIGQYPGGDPFEAPATALDGPGTARAS
ncbi:MAG: hypothetical protein U5Q44_03755 [Dehalococcoidia bacterium]|nr:hypothetical protein [Dehalococcoidia bacterium]